MFSQFKNLLCRKLFVKRQKSTLIREGFLKIVDSMMPTHYGFEALHISLILHHIFVDSVNGTILHAFVLSDSRLITYPGLEKHKLLI